LPPPRSLLSERIKDVSATLGPGSRVVFMNCVPEEAFASHMNSVQMKALKARQLFSSTEDMRSPAEEAVRGVDPRFEILRECQWKGKHTTTHATWLLEKRQVLVTHIHGDPASQEDLKPLIDAYAFSACIVLGTAADGWLSPTSRDSRVLSITLLLKHLISERRRLQNCQTPTHIVAENQIDQTSLLVLAPSQSRTMRENQIREDMPDFVNSQATIARALCQVLAYPELKGPIWEIFSDDKNTADIDIVSAGDIVPLGTELSFAVVQQCVQLSQPKVEECTGDVCLGYITIDGHIRLVPDSSSKRSYREHERLIILTHLPESNDDDEVSPVVAVALSPSP